MQRSLPTFIVRFLTTSLLAIGLLSTVSANDAVLIEFTSQNCVHCRAMEPVMQQLQKEGVAVRHVDVDREADMAVRFSVDQLPTYVIYSSGKEVARLVGRQPITTVRQALMSTAHVQVTPTNSSSTQPATPQFARQSLEPQTPNTHLVPAPASLEQASARAQQATVRLRVYEVDDVGFGVGTGTVIDARQGEYLVLTCGHLFRDTDGKGKIEVDVFHNGQVQTVAGNLIDFSAKDRDIALVSIKSPLPITPVPIRPSSQPIRNGDSVFSYGCDRGADPSLRPTRITGIDKYNQHLKVSNIEIAGAPIDGRSGGGLFDSQGCLIGVCNAADYQGDIGIYAGPGEVYWQLARVGLQSLHNSPGPNSDPSANVASLPQPAPQAPMQFASAATGGDQEVIIIVRDRNRPDAPARVKVLEQAPADLLRYVE